MERTFSKEDTNIVKGIAILIIACHHIFWNELFVVDWGGEKSSVYFL